MRHDLLRVAAKKRAASGGSGTPFTPSWNNVKFLMDMEQSPPTDYKGASLQYQAGAVRTSAWAARGSTYSLGFNGTTTAYVYSSWNNTGLQIGTNAYCIELDLNLDKTTGEQWLFDFRNTAGSHAPALYLNGASIYYYTGGAVRISGAHGMVVGLKHFILLSRFEGITRLFIDGVQIGANYTDASNYEANYYAPLIGAPNVGTFSGRTLLGKIDNFRLTIGEGIGVPPAIPAAPYPTS
jgi:hypothetical protein